MDITHVPSRVYISGVNIHDKLGRGILLGGFHMLVQNSSFKNITATGLAAIFSSFFRESIGASDIAIRNNTFVGTNYVPKLYQTSADGMRSPESIRHFRTSRFRITRSKACRVPESI